MFFAQSYCRWKKVPPPTIFKIYIERGHKSSPTPIVRVYFDNIGSLNQRTYLFGAPGNFTNFTQLILLVYLFTGQVRGRARVRSDRWGPTIGQK